jgi:serine/threonine-protein kinase
MPDPQQAVLACPSCREQYPAGVTFCPKDGAQLVTGPVEQPTLIGTVLAERYRIVRKIGEGGMGEVFEAQHVYIDKRYAIKTLRPEITTSPEAIARFHQEARSASTIGHENIVSIDDFGRLPDGGVYLAMEFLEGESLADRMKKGSALGYAEKLEVMAQVCRGLAAAHEKGIVHRDMKPENIFLARKGDRVVVKVLDFGIAKVTSDNAHDRLTQTGSIFGTPFYMSPEQALGKALDGRTDIYSVGVILYEVFTGRVPFVGESFMGILSQHITKAPPRPRDTAPFRHVPDEIEHVILRALAKDPAARFASMHELGDELERLLGAEPSEPLPAPTRAHPAARSGRRGPDRGAGAGAYRARARAAGRGGVRAGAGADGGGAVGAVRRGTAHRRRARGGASARRGAGSARRGGAAPDAADRAARRRAAAGGRGGVHGGDARPAAPRPARPHGRARSRRPVEDDRADGGGGARHRADRRQGIRRRPAGRRDARRGQGPGRAHAGRADPEGRLRRQAGGARPGARAEAGGAPGARRSRAPPERRAPRARARPRRPPPLDGSAAAAAAGHAARSVSGLGGRMRRLVASITLLVFVLVTLPARRARAQQAEGPKVSASDGAPGADPGLERAKAHFEAGRNAYIARDYATAIREFRAAQAIRPSPILEFNVAMSYEALGKPRQAAYHYRRYVQGRPDADNRAEVEQRIAALQAQAGQEPAPPQPATETAPAATAEAAAAEPPPAQSQDQQPAQQPPQQPQQQQYQQQYQQPDRRQAQQPPSRYYSDPYAGSMQTFVPPSAPAKPRRNLWWIVFPIIGGIALAAGLIYVAVTYGGSGTPCVGASCYAADHAPLGAPQGGFQLRF